MAMQVENSMTPKMAGEKLGLSKRMICEYCKQGRIKAVFRHGQYWIEPKSLEEFEKIPRRRGNPGFGKSEK
jgi:predicted site-specific integrase-resolvase